MKITRPARRIFLSLYDDKLMNYCEVWPSDLGSRFAWESNSYIYTLWSESLVRWPPIEGDHCSEIGPCATAEEGKE